MEPHPVLPTGPEALERAVAHGGPLDGTVLGLADTDSYEVRLADRTRWSYVATGERERLPDGSEGVVYVCAGRLTGD